MRKTEPPPNPAEVEYKHARILMNAQELMHPVIYKEKPHYIKCFIRDQDPLSSGLKTYVHLSGNPEMIPASEITLQEQPK